MSKANSSLADEARALVFHALSLDFDVTLGNGSYRTDAKLESAGMIGSVNAATMINPYTNCSPAKP